MTDSILIFDTERNLILKVRNLQECMQKLIPNVNLDLGRHCFRLHEYLAGTYAAAVYNSS